MATAWRLKLPSKWRHFQASITDPLAEVASVCACGDGGSTFGASVEIFGLADQIQWTRGQRILPLLRGGRQDIDVRDQYSLYARELQARHMPQVCVGGGERSGDQGDIFDEGVRPKAFRVRLGQAVKAPFSGVPSMREESSRLPSAMRER
ncbi:hypothetical protein JTE90_025056 [Oedothorax gibbosus]|uniref:Uncharacterized protein n=1 Tax=Oedothorax gibbosus TaxID=931172 RepID=A0AAV6TSI6_9ARAC|nr:hypothetical protein JTE90_025056 [Oedothorax gibbosus]